MHAKRIDQGLYRILIPFEDLTTTVYIAVFEQGTAIIDSGTYPTDVDGYILPALAELGVEAESVRFLLLTHRHGDHAGGFSRLQACFPHAKADGALPEGLIAVPLPGHTEDSVGYLCGGTLLSGDCLQLKGIGKYRNGISDRDAYLKSIRYLKTLGLTRIVAAHEYDPLGSLAEGRTAVDRYLDCCEKIALL